MLFITSSQNELSPMIENSGTVEFLCTKKKRSKFLNRLWINLLNTCIPKQPTLNMFGGNRFLFD